NGAAACQAQGATGRSRPNQCPFPRNVSGFSLGNRQRRRESEGSLRRSRRRAKKPWRKFSSVCLSCAIQFPEIAQIAISRGKTDAPSDVGQLVRLASPCRSTSCSGL